MSVLAESMESSKHFGGGDNPFDLPDVDGDALMDLGLGQELVDPQLTMLYPGGQRERPQQDIFSMNPALIWDTPVDTTVDASLSVFDSAVPSQDDTADIAALAEPLSASSPSSAANLSSRRTSKASRTSSKSSAPSLSSSTSHTMPRKRVRKPSRKKQEEQPPTPQLIKSESSAGIDGEDDAKRTKYLERNRVAASKCRQKKKEWVHELEESKAEMEAKHVELLRQHAMLVSEVGMMKNLLMRHAGCKDPNIDQWLDLEAKKFVQKSTHDTDDPAASRRLSFSQSLSLSASASRRASLTGINDSPEPLLEKSLVFADSLNPLSPAPSPLQFQSSPIIKMEEINYDHMPDDMFND